jgi:hypothetical protein
MKKSWLAVMLLFGACASKPQHQGMSNAGQSQVSTVGDSLKPISEVLANHASAWMSIPGVTGTGEGQKDGKPAVLIFVDSMTDSLKTQLPVNVEGYPVVVKESGNVKAHSSE